jgi:hypothetical protein
MNKLIAGGLTALTLATAVAVGTPAAQADGWRDRGYHEGYHRGRGPGVGAVLGAGILGLAVGAAVAGHDRGHHDRYDYDDGPPVYYRAPPPAYYSGPYYYGYVDECRVHYRWDPYWRRYVEVERCD